MSPTSCSLRQATVKPIKAAPVPRDVRVPAALVLPVGLLLLLPAASAHGAPDFLIWQENGEWMSSSPHADVTAELVSTQPGEAYRWHLAADMARGRLVGEIVVPAGHFDVERSRQVVPQVDDALFVEVAGEAAVQEAAGPARVVNITHVSAAGFSYLLSFPVPTGGEAALTLTRDVEPPGFVVGAVRNVTHNGFYVETETTEPAWAALWVRPEGAGPDEAVEHRTTTPAFLQRFPVVGLQPETPYVFHIAFRDWAGNVAASAEVQVTTTERSVGESPRILSLVPEGDSVWRDPPPAIEATFDPVAGLVPRGGVRLFVDLEEVTERATIEANRARYVPAAPFAPGDHVVRIELVNTAGGEAWTRWEFRVEGEAAAAPLNLSLLVVVAAALALAALRRGSPWHPTHL